jgi:hypothetical protein
MFQIAKWNTKIFTAWPACLAAGKAKTGIHIFNIFLGSHFRLSGARRVGMTTIGFQ